jgi:hypothetical protein
MHVSHNIIVQNSNIIQGISEKGKNNNPSGFKDWIVDTAAEMERIMIYLIIFWWT